jgi:GINS complex subunit 4
MSLMQEILQLESALRREKVSPEILMFEENLVNKVITRLEEKQEDLSTTPIENFEQQFDVLIYQLDIDRVKYLLSAYLRTRILKIQALAINIVLKDQFSMLSTKEYSFVEKYFLIKTNHFKKSFLLKIPEDFRKIEHEENSKSPDTGPDLDKHVFIKALDSIGRFEVNPGEHIEISKDDVYLLRYSLIKPLLLTNKIDLI